MSCLVFIIIYNTPKLAEIPYMNPLTWQQNPQIYVWKFWCHEWYPMSINLNAKVVFFFHIAGKYYFYN